LASEYGWSLEHIFNFVTPVDVRKLMPYATERHRRKDGDMYKNLINIIHIASYHPEKGRNTDVEKLYNSYNESDHSYVNAKFDAKGLASLGAIAKANREKAVDKRR
jgi:hypothetical protein